MPAAVGSLQGWESATFPAIEASEGPSASCQASGAFSNSHGGVLWVSIVA